jgi:hypothetical protein
MATQLPSNVRASDPWQMTLKIEQISGKRRTRIRLSGELRCQDIDQVKAEIVRSSPRLVLDLEEVDLVDLEGVRFLNFCYAEGIGLLHCSPYIMKWMLRERAALRRARSVVGRKPNEDGNDIEG